MKPRYMEIVASLRADIASGRYPVGSLLPAEKELTEQFGVSRFTVREAFRILTEARLIERRQGARSTVLSADAEPEYRADFFTVDATVEFAHDHSPRYLDVQEEEVFEARGPMARLLRCDEGREWRVLRGPRRDGRTNAIVASCELYIWAEFESGPYEPSPTIASQICDRYSLEINAIQVELSAILLNPDEAEILDSEPDSPGLQVVRRFVLSQGRSFEVVKNVFKGDLVNYSMAFHRRGRESEALPTRI
jgi:DNA-binding GntR family transcriptional regulator